MTQMTGPVEVAFRDFVIPPSILSEGTFTYTEGTRERTTLAGTFTRPSGTMETGTFEVTLYAPSVDWLGKNILRSKYTAPTAPQTTGNMIWSTDNCVTMDTGPLNLHFQCEGNDNNDVHIYAAELQVNIEQVYNNTDDVTVGLVFHIQPDDQGRTWRWGTGDLTAESVWDATTETTVAA